MGMFPWDDVFYHVSQKEKDLNDMYNRYLSQRDAISAQGAHYNSQLDTLQAMNSYNYALLVVAAQTQMSESDYAQWLQSDEFKNPPRPSHSMVIQVFQLIAELVGMIDVGVFIWKVGSAAKNAIFRKAAQQAADDAGEGLEEGWVDLVSDDAINISTDIGVNEVGDIGAEAVVSAAVESGAEAGSEAGAEAVGAAVAESSSAALGIAGAGAGIFLALGLDMILGAVDGAKEAKELNENKRKLQAALDVLDQYLGKLNDHLDTLDGYILDEEKKFFINMKLLNAIQTATFDWQYEVTLGNAASIVAAMNNALAEYGYVSTIRVSWRTMKANKPDLTWDTFSLFMLMDKPTGMSDETAQKFLDYSRDKLLGQPAPALV